MKYGRYEIVRRLGAGSMGEVYLAHDPNIDRRVALKVLHRQHITSKEIVQRFIKEAKAIGRLSHPHIVNVYDVGQDHGTIYIAMEYLEGQILNEAVQSMQLDFETIVNIIRQVALALNYAHQKGIVHRDIKPSNLILIDNHQVKLTDFGIAHLEDASLTLKTSAEDIFGTPAYMSPEQITGNNADHRSDLYALGVILYELLAKQRPFVGNNIPDLFQSITKHKFVPPNKANPSLPNDLNAIVVKAMAKDPKKRFQTGQDFASALSDCLVIEKTTVLSKKTTLKPKRLGWIFVLLVVALASWWVYYSVVPHPPAMTPVNFTSEPTDASIYIDNTFTGKTPMRLKLPLGKYNVRLTLSDHFESEAQIDVSGSEEIPVHLRLIPLN